MINMPLSHSVVIFDLDGTLVDSARDLSQTLNYILAGEGLPPLAPDLTRHMVGHGALAMMKKGFEVAGRPFPEGEEKEQLRSQFIAHYADHIADHTIVFDGVAETMAALTDMGAKLAVCTNKTIALADKLLGALGMQAQFEMVLGRDSLATWKPSPEPLLHIMHHTDRKSGVMVGDSYTDRDAARAAGLPCALATFGYGALNEPLRRHERLFSHFGDLPPIIRGLTEADAHPA